MAYTRKTKDIYILMSNYGYGWEEETTEETREQAQQTLKEYRQNTNAQHKIIKKRIPINNK